MTAQKQAQAQAQAMTAYKRALGGLSRPAALSPALAMLCERTLSPMLAAVVAATEEGR